MEIFFASLRHTWIWALRLGVVLIILCALLLSAGRLLLPYGVEYRADLERLIGQYLDAQVRIGKLEAAWHGWKPVLRLEDLSIGDPGRDFPRVSFQQARVSLDLFHSVLGLSPVLSSIRLEGVHLTLERTAGGEVRLFSQASGQALAPLEDLAGWLFQIQSLDLLSAQLQVHDAAGVIPPLLLSELGLSLRSRKDGWRLDLMAKLPESLGKAIHAAIELQGQAGDPAGWAGKFYVQGEELVLSGWQLPVGRSASRTDTAVWGDWQSRQPLTLRGKAKLLNPPGKSPGIAQPRLLDELPSYELSFQGRRDGPLWRWQGDWTGFDKTHRSGLRASLDLTKETPEDGNPGLLEVRGRGLRVQDLIPLAFPWLDDRQRALLLDLSPTGLIPELVLKATLPDDGYLSAQQSENSVCSEEIAACQRSPKGKLVALAARFTGLGGRGKGLIPGIRGLDGAVSLSEDNGRIDLDSQALQLDGTSLWRTPLLLKNLSGPILWRRDDKGIRLESSGLKIANPALSGELRGSVTLSKDGVSPLLDLNMDYQSLDIGRLRQLLPAAIMHPKLLKWLDRALVSGRIPAGGLVFRGHTADFPFDKGQGLFETRFQVQDTILDYFPEWPRLEELEAEVTFRNRSLQVEAVAGKILAGNVSRVEARIGDLEHGVLEIRGRSRQSGAALLRFLQASPLADKVDSYLAGAEMQGENTLNLELTIPLDPRPNRVKGSVDFTESSLNLPVWNIEFRRIQGQLGFTEAGLNARNLQLALRGEPLQLDIDTRTVRNRRETRFSLRGRLGLRALIGGQSSQLTPYFSGRGHWDMVLTVPGPPAGGTAPFEFELSSDLRGIGVDLPSPLGKAAAESRSMRIQLSEAEANDSLLLKLDYGPAIRAVLELANSSRQLRLNRGELRIAAGEAKLPNGPGLAVIADLPRFDLLSALGVKSQAGGSLLSWLSILQAQFDELVIGGQRFNKVRLKAKNQHGTLSGQLQGEGIAGRISVPAQPQASEPLLVELQYLSLRTGNSQPAVDPQSLPLDPGNIPPFRLGVQDLILDGNSLGKLRLQLSPQGDLRLLDSELQSDLYQISVSGDWALTKEGPISHLQAGLRSPDLGKTLKTFGYTAALEGGKTEASLTASMPGPLLQFSPALLNGRLEIRIEKGRLPEVEPGVGRVFGLVNLGSLSRRLALDFSDFFRQGLSFDRIDGSFALKDGHAYTDNLMLRGPSAHIHIGGRIGLAARDYDQIITVTPQMGASLSLASTIAGGPAVGAAVFVAENLFKRQLEKVTSYQYTMTGSWENPVVTRRSTPRVPPSPSRGGDG